MLTAAEQNYYFALQELHDEIDEYGCVGAGIGMGINNTHKLKVLDYDGAMGSTDSDKWEESVEQEHERMVKNKVWKLMTLEDASEDVDVIDSTWAMKKKANGDYRARLVAQGFKQMQGKSFVNHNISSPVVHDITMHIMLVLMLMGKLAVHLVDVNGAILLGCFKPEERIYMKVPKGFQKFYPSGGLLFLQQTLYGDINAAKAFWKLLLGIMNELGYVRNWADLCCLNMC